MPALSVLKVHFKGFSSLFPPFSMDVLTEPGVALHTSVWLGHGPNTGGLRTLTGFGTVHESGGLRSQGHPSALLEQSFLNFFHLGLRHFYVTPGIQGYKIDAQIKHLLIVIIKLFILIQFFSIHK